jgi:LPS export ABC transporter protein LptC
MVYQTQNRLSGIVLLFLTVLSLGIYSCEEESETKESIVYNGPLMVTEDLLLTFSDSGKVTIKLTTAEQKKLQNSDEVYPKAVYVTFYNKDIVEYSSLRGDSGRYISSENKYIIKGNVFFYNREQQQSLSTEELIWNPITKKVNCNSKVVVNTPNDRLEGMGMEAAQDFSTFQFSKVTGIFAVDSLITQAPKVDSTG